MSNRKKLKDNSKRLKKTKGVLFGQAGLAQSMLRAEVEPDTIPDEVLESMGLRVALSDEESVVIKEVPAKVDGVVVGVAYLHDDGSVAIRYNEDAPQEALDKIKATEKEVGYSLETGAPIRGSS